ncbi:35285_t:CDS:2, partial [Gigaspora margarita]
MSIIITLTNKHTNHKYWSDRMIGSVIYKAIEDIEKMVLFAENYFGFLVGVSCDMKHYEESVTALAFRNLPM